MTHPENWAPRPDSVPARAIKWLSENGKTGHRMLSEKIDAERMSMSSLLKRSIEAGLIIQTHEQGEYHYDVPPEANPPAPPQEAPPSAEDLARAKQDSANLLTAAMRDVVAVARFPAATMEEAYEELATGDAGAAPALLEVGVASGQTSEAPYSPALAEALAIANGTLPVHDDLRLDLGIMNEAEVAAAGASEPEELVLEHATGDDFRCAIYSDGRFVMIIGGATVILHKSPADLLREYVRKHWPADSFSGAVRGSM